MRNAQGVRVVKELYSRYHMGWLLLAGGLVMLLGHLWRLPMLNHVGNGSLPIAESIDQFSRYAFSEYRYSDILAMFLKHRLYEFDGPGYIIGGVGTEYPAAIALLIRATAAVAVGYNPGAYLWLNFAVNLASGLVLVWLLAKWPGARTWLFVASPLLFVFTTYNWDLPILALMLGGFTLLRRSTEQPDAGRSYNVGLEVAGFLLLAVAVWCKLFPVVFVGAAVLDRLRRRQWSVAGLGVGIFAAVSLTLNLPLYFFGRKAWDYFWWVHSHRPTETSVWLWQLCGMNFEECANGGETALINRLSAIVVIAGGLAITAAVYFARPRSDRFVLVGALYLLWWFSFNKIYDPNYDLWLLLFAALFAAPLWLGLFITLVAGAWYVAVFQGLNFTYIAPDPAIHAWYNTHTLLLVLLLRLALLATLFVWIGRRLFAADRQPVEIATETLMQPGRLS